MAEAAGAEAASSAFTDLLQEALLPTRGDRRITLPAALPGGKNETAPFGEAGSLPKTPAPSTAAPVALSNVPTVPSPPPVITPDALTDSAAPTVNDAPLPASPPPPPDANASGPPPQDDALAREPSRDSGGKSGKDAQVTPRDPRTAPHRMLNAPVGSRDDARPLSSGATAVSAPDPSADSGLSQASRESKALEPDGGSEGGPVEKSPGAAEKPPVASADATLMAWVDAPRPVTGFAPPPLPPPPPDSPQKASAGADRTIAVSGPSSPMGRSDTPPQTLPHAESRAPEAATPAVPPSPLVASDHAPAMSLASAASSSLQETVAAMSAGDGAASSDANSVASAPPKASSEAEGAPSPPSSSLSPPTRASVPPAPSLTMTVSGVASGNGAGVVTEVVTGESAPRDQAILPTGEAASRRRSPSAFNGSLEGAPSPSGALSGAEAAVVPSPAHGPAPAAPTHAAAPAPSVDPAAVLEQVVRVVRAEAPRGRQEIVLRLDPPDLGHLRIHITTDSGDLSARFHADTDTTRQLLEANLPELRRSLAAAGISVGTLDLPGGPAPVGVHPGDAGAFGLSDPTGGFSDSSGQGRQPAPERDPAPSRSPLIESQPTLNALEASLPARRPSRILDYRA